MSNIREAIENSIKIQESRTPTGKTSTKKRDMIDVMRIVTDAISDSTFTTYKDREDFIVDRLGKLYNAAKEVREELGMGESKPGGKTNSGYTPSKVYRDELDKRIADELWGNGRTISNNNNTETSVIIDEPSNDIDEELNNRIADEISRQLKSVKFKEWLIDTIASMIETMR